MENKIINRLKELEFDYDNYIGVLYLINNSEDIEKSQLKMLEYLEDDLLTPNSRNEIFEYAFKLSKINKEEYIIEDEDDNKSYIF